MCSVLSKTKHICRDYHSTLSYNYPASLNIKEVIRMSRIPLRLIITLLFILNIPLVNAQVGSESHVRDIINEKVRIPEYNQFAHSSYDIHLEVKNGLISKQEGDARLAELKENLRRTGIDNQLREAIEIESGAEPCIAINPQNTDQLAVAFMQLDDFPIYYSRDGGSTWTQSRTTTTQLWREVNPSAGGRSLGGGDPILVYDNEGVLHLTYILLDFVG